MTETQTPETFKPDATLIYLAMYDRSREEAADVRVQLGLCVSDLQYGLVSETARVYRMNALCEALDAYKVARGES